MEKQKTKIANITLKEKNKVRGQVLSNLKIYYTPTVINTVWYWQKNR